MDGTVLNLFRDPFRGTKVAHLAHSGARPTHPAERNIHVKPPVWAASSPRALVEGPRATKHIYSDFTLPWRAILRSCTLVYLERRRQQRYPMHAIIRWAFELLITELRTA
jgi:hypothetical protein